MNQHQIIMKAAAFGAGTMDRYTNKEKVGGGAYGDVYKGIDIISGEIIAIKKIKLEVISAL